MSGYEVGFCLASTALKVGPHNWAGRGAEGQPVRAAKGDERCNLDQNVGHTWASLARWMGLRRSAR